MFTNLIADNWNERRLEKKEGKKKSPEERKFNQVVLSGDSLKIISAEIKYAVLRKLLLTEAPGIVDKSWPFNQV